MGKFHERNMHEESFFIHFDDTQHIDWLNRRDFFNFKKYICV